VVEGALHDIENVVLHHARLVAYGHNDVPLGELRHTLGNRAKAGMWGAQIAIKLRLAEFGPACLQAGFGARWAR
jgi:hypothetical protein